MSALIINYRQLNNLTSTARSLSRKLSSRMDDYSGIRKGMSGIYSSRNNISQANYFIQKKNDRLQEKKDKIDTFIIKVSDFKREAFEADRRVARRISSDTKSFKKVNNISISFFSAIGLVIENKARSWFGRDTVNAIKSSYRNIKYVIKDWYHDKGGKYIVNIVVDTAKVVLAVAAFVALVASGAGFAALFFAGFSIYNAATTYGYDIAAASTYHSTGNRSIADRIDAKGGREFAMATNGIRAEIIAMILHQDREAFRKGGEALGSLIYDGISVAAAVYSIYKIGSGAKKFFFGKDFYFRSFYQDLKTNAQTGSSTFQEILKNNITRDSVVKMFKDYKAIQDISFFDGVSKSRIVTDVFTNNFIKKEWTTISGFTSNFKTIKSILKGDNTYALPSKIGSTIKKGYKSFKNIIETFNEQSNPKKATRIHRVQFSY